MKTKDHLCLFLDLLSFDCLSKIAFRIGKPYFHASMQSDFSLFMQSKLSFRVTPWFFFSRCRVTFLRNHLNFQNSFVLDKHQHDFSFCTKLWIPKNPCEHVRLCIVLKERKTHPKILGVMVSCLKIMLNMLFAWNNNKNEGML